LTPTQLSSKNIRLVCEKNKFNTASDSKIRETTRDTVRGLRETKEVLHVSPYLTVKRCSINQSRQV